MKDQRAGGRDVDRVRALLEKAAPQDSGASYRAESVVRRGRRTRTRNGAISALAVGVAAAAVIIGPAFIDSSPVTNEATDPPNSATTTPSNPAPPTGPAYANPCPSSPVKLSDPRNAAPFAAERLGPNTARVRLCRASIAGVSSRWEPPADALVDGVDDFAAQVAELPAADPDPCPTARPTPQPFALQITDSAGATQTLGSAFTTCGVVTINSKLISAEALLAAFRQSLTEQRANLEPQLTDTTMGCRGADTEQRVRLGWMSEVTGQTRFIAATTCQPPWITSGGGDDLQPASASGAIDLLNQEWATQARDLRTQQPVRADRCPNIDLLLVPLYLKTTWGDVVRMRMTACGDYRIGHFQLPMSEELLHELGLPYQPELHWTVPDN